MEILEFNEEEDQHGRTISIRQHKKKKSHKQKEGVWITVQDIGKEKTAEERS